MCKHIHPILQPICKAIIHKGGRIPVEKVVHRFPSCFGLGIALPFGEKHEYIFCSLVFQDFLNLPLVLMPNFLLWVQSKIMQWKILTLGGFIVKLFELVPMHTLEHARLDFNDVAPLPRPGRDRARPNPTWEGLVGGEKGSGFRAFKRSATLKCLSFKMSETMAPT